MTIRSVVIDEEVKVEIGEGKVSWRLASGVFSLSIAALLLNYC